MTPGASHGVFLPLRDINRAQLPRGSHTPRFRPRRFTRPRRLAPPSALRVCFAPLPRPGFSLQGFSLPRSRTASSAAVPSRRCRPLAARGCPPAPPAAGPSSGPCSARESVFASMGFSHRPEPIPSWASPPPGVSPRTRRTGSPFAPLSILSVQASQSPAPMTLSVSLFEARPISPETDRPARGS